MNVSSPKFIEPDFDPRDLRLRLQAGDALVDRHVVGALVETMVSMSVPARIRSITSTNSSGRPLGVPPSSRTCRWATFAPAALASMLESAISAVV